MHVRASSVESGRFFAVADDPPDNVYIMRVRPRNEPGLCENITHNSLWNIEGHKLVRLIAETEYDKTTFFV